MARYSISINLLALQILNANNCVDAFAPSSVVRLKYPMQLAAQKAPKRKPEAYSEQTSKQSEIPYDPSSVFEAASGVDEFLHEGLDLQQDDSSTELSLEYSIENEVALKEFIKIVNEKDRGISPDSVFDLDDMINQLIDKAFDTTEDAMLMFRRKMNENNFLEDKDSLNADALSEWNDPKQAHKPRVLVVGSGWASHAFIKCIDTEKFRILVCSPSNYFVFTPMLASSSVGTTEIRSIIESTRDANPTVKFLEGKGLDIDTENKYMTVKLGEGNIIDDGPDNVEQEIIQIPYDICVYSAGVGPISSSSRTPGLSRKNVHFLKSVEDARRLRSTVITLLEQASQPGLTGEERRKLLTFVVVGGGPTGVEYCGELCDFLNDVTGKDVRTSKVKRSVAPFASLAKFTSVKLLQGNEDVLPMFDKELRIRAEESLINRGVHVMTKTRVSRIEGSKKIVIADQNDKETELNCGLIVWAAGTQPVKLTEKVIESVDKASIRKGLEVTPKSLSERGRIPVDNFQRVLGAPAGSMIAIGDASGTVNADGKLRNLPQTAQVAAQQGAYVARLLNRGYNLSGLTDCDEENTVENSLYLPVPENIEAKNDKEVARKLRGAVKAKPFKFLNLGQLAYTGGGEALSQVQLGNLKLFNSAGSEGFLLWRSVYIVKQVSTKTRLLVLFDWFKTKLFGRDVTRM